MNTNEILTGDCRDVLADLPESSVHMCMTSPPYFGLRDYGHDEQIGLEDELSEYVDELVAVGDELKRVLRDDGSWWLNLGDTYRDKQKLLVPERVSIALQRNGWILRNDVTWHKPNPMPQSVKDRLNTTTEEVFHLVPSKRYWYDLDAIRKEPRSDDPRVQDGGRWETDLELEKGGQQDSFASVHPGGKNPGDVFEVTTKPFPDAHFAVYPPELCEKPIKATCPPKVCSDCGKPYNRITETIPIWEQPRENVERDQSARALEIADEKGLTTEHLEAARSVWIGNLDSGEGNPYERVDKQTATLAKEASDALGSYYREALLSEPKPTDEWEQSCDCATDAVESGICLDPFAGAGTTLMKAKELRRRFIGIELNPEYADIARNRCGLAVENTSTLAGDGQASVSDF